MTLSVVHTTYSAWAAARFAARVFDLPEHATARLVSRGFNDVYEIAGCNCFLRIGQHGRRSLAAAEGEGQALAEAKRAGVPVAAALAGRDGRFAQPFAAAEGERPALLIEAAPGIDAAVHYAAAQGRALGLLHSLELSGATRGLLRRLDLDTLVRTPTLQAAQALGDQGDRAELARRLEIVAAALNDHICPLVDTLGTGFCHGDFHGANALIDGDTATLIDFDDSGIGWPAYDLASFLWTCQGLDPEERETVWPDFLAAYRAVRPIAPADLLALEALVVVREIWTLGGWAAGSEHWGDGWLRSEDFAGRVAAIEERFERLVERRLV